MSACGASCTHCCVRAHSYGAHGSVYCAQGHMRIVHVHPQRKIEETARARDRVESPADCPRLSVSTVLQVLGLTYAFAHPRSLVRVGRVFSQVSAKGHRSSHGACDRQLRARLTHEHSTGGNTATHSTEPPAKRRGRIALPPVHWRERSLHFLSLGSIHSVYGMHGASAPFGWLAATFALSARIPFTSTASVSWAVACFSIVATSLLMEATTFLSEAAEFSPFVAVLPLAAASCLSRSATVVSARLAFEGEGDGEGEAPTECAGECASTTQCYTDLCCAKMS